MSNKKVVFITNIPAPYRESVHANASKKFNGEYIVFYCASIEANRSWKLDLGEYKKEFLSSRLMKFRNRTIYLTSNIYERLNSNDPDVLIIGGFSIPMLVAYFWAFMKGRSVISFTDANLDSETSLSILHKYIRKFFYSKSDACIGASKKSLKLYEYYGVSEKKLFQSHLCADNDYYTGFLKDFHSRDYDILLCGQMIQGKMFDFSLDVITELFKLKKDLKIKVLGSGPLKEHIISRLQKIGVGFDYPGFVEQRQLPIHYTASKLFFFPSVKDAWGVVANEACAAGTPVFTCPVVGAANELIVNNFNGFVLDTVVDDWVNAAHVILSNSALWGEMSNNALEACKEYSYTAASTGIYQAVDYVRSIK